MLTNTKIEKYRFFAYKFLIPCLLILPVLFFSLPLITKGADNLRMIGHFDPDEASLVEYAGETYSHVFVPLKENAAYPQLFYYVSGIFLFPFTFLHGINHHVITIVLRASNVLYGVATGILIYFLLFRLFKSVWIGIISSLLFTTTPEYLWWLVNARPHPLEILFILMIFYFCLMMVDAYRKKLLIATAIFIGLATATKLGGLFTVPPVLFTCLYSFSKVKTADLKNYLKNKASLIHFICITMLIVSILIPIVSAFLYMRLHEKFFVLGIDNLSEFMHSRDYRLLLAGSLFLFLISFFWFSVNIFSRTAYKDNAQAEKFKNILVINKSFLTLFLILSTTFLIFIIFTPHYLLYPLKTVKKTGFQFVKSTMSTSLDPGLHKPILDSGGLVWFKMLFDNSIFNSWFGALFLMYALIELFNFRKEWNNNRTSLIKRLILWSYIITLFSILVIFLSHRPHHYLLPIAMTMCILIGYGIVAIAKISPHGPVRSFLIVIVSWLLIAGFYDRSHRITYLYDAKAGKVNAIDTGIVMGEWLKDHYDTNSIIWKDSSNFYIPPEFKKIAFMRHEDDISSYFSQINQLEPDLMVITSRSDKNLTNVRKVEAAIESGALRGFNQVKKFLYTGPLALDNTEFGAYIYIYIYERTNK